MNITDFKQILACSLLITLGFSVFQTTGAKGKKPGWVARSCDSSSQYPTDLYLTGFGTATGVDQESQQIAQDNVRASLSRQVLVKINNTISNQQEEIGSDLSQQVSSVTQSTTSLQVMDLKSEIYIDDSRKPSNHLCLKLYSATRFGQSISAGKKEARNGDSKTDPTSRNQAGEPEGAHPPILLPNLAPIWKADGSWNNFVAGFRDLPAGGSSLSRAGKRATAPFKKRDLRLNPTTGAV